MRILSKLILARERQPLAQSTWAVTSPSPRKRPHLKLPTSTQESTSEFCDLGLVTKCNLSWNNHIDKITSKANKILGLTKRTCRGLKDVSTLRTLYLALVRSQLEFCTVVWSPYQARDITKLERIHRRATKLILRTTDATNEEK